MLAEHKKTKEKVAIKIVNTGIIGKHKYDVKLSGNA
jgi:hypothetical protein